MRERPRSGWDDEPKKEKGRLAVALESVNPIVVGLYVVHAVALVVLYVSAIVELGAIFVPTVGVAILTTIELLIAVKYLDNREALARNFEREKSQVGQTGVGRVRSGPFVRAQSGDEEGQA